MKNEIKCPKCNEPMVLGKKNFQFGLIELYDTECMICPKCEHKMYTDEQHRNVLKTIDQLNSSLTDAY